MTPGISLLLALLLIAFSFILGIAARDDTAAVAGPAGFAIFAIVLAFLFNLPSPL